jgi:ribose transport system substrate-binding protein
MGFASESERLVRIARTLRYAVPLVFAVLCSCSGGARQPVTSGPKIGVELPLLTSPFWQAYNDYLPRYARASQLDLLPPSSADGDTSKFLTDTQNLIAEGVSGLVLSPTDTAAAASTLDRAAAKNIPVVAVDVAPDRGTVFMVVRADNREYGRLACEYIGQHVRTGSVVQIEGDLASINGRDRTAAFSDCMRSRFPALRVLAVAAQWDAAKAEQGLEALYTANPDIKAIYLQAGGVYLAPALAVLQRHSALVPASDARHIVIVSNDGIPQELNAIRKGQIDATVSQPADLYARYGLFYIKAALEGKRFNPGPTAHDSRIVRLPNGMLEDQLQAPLVTRANVNDPRFWGNGQRA